jgi:hypothetical protein
MTQFMVHSSGNYSLNRIRDISIPAGLLISCYSTIDSGTSNRFSAPRLGSR